MSIALAAKALMYLGTLLTLAPALHIFKLAARESDLQPASDTPKGVRILLKTGQNFYQKTMRRHGRHYFAVFAVGLFLFILGALLDLGCDLNVFGVCMDAGGAPSASAP